MKPQTSQQISEPGPACWNRNGLYTKGGMLKVAKAASETGSTFADHPP